MCLRLKYRQTDCLKWARSLHCWHSVYHDQDLAVALYGEREGSVRDTYSRYFFFLKIRRVSLLTLALTHYSHVLLTVCDHVNFSLFQCFQDRISYSAGCRFRIHLNCMICCMNLMWNVIPLESVGEHFEINFPGSQFRLLKNVKCNASLLNKKHA